ncbi:MAG: phosphopantetheine-binding protein [Planctomycetota bacterium]
MSEIGAFEQRIKKLIVEQLRLDIDPNQIESSAPIFGEKLGLDSIDALELIVGIESTFGVKVTDPNEWKKILYSVNTLAEYLERHSSQKSS